MQASELAFIDTDRLAEQLRVKARGYCAAYLERTGEMPEAELIASAMLLALRGGCSNAQAIAAMFVGLKVIAAEAVAGTVH